MKLLSVGLAFSCAVAIALPKSVAAETTDKTAPKWGYDAEERDELPPTAWGDKFPNCNGKRQSPIALETPDKCESDDERVNPLQFDGACSDFHLKQHDDVFKGEVLEGSCTVTAGGGKPYSLLQFHMHSPSEHTLDGKHYDAEAHFVHKNDDGLLVIGLFVEKQDGAETNKWIKDVWGQLDSVHANKTSSLELKSYADLLRTSAETGTLYTYPGSLTTPPCDETVEWWVLHEPVVVASEDFDKFLDHSTRLPALDDGQGSRPTQPLNGRKVKVY